MKKSIFLLIVGILGIGSIIQSQDWGRRPGIAEKWSIDRSKLRASQISETTPSRFASARQYATQKLQALKRQYLAGKISPTRFLQEQNIIEKQSKIAQELPSRPEEAVVEQTSVRPTHPPRKLSLETGWALKDAFSPVRRHPLGYRYSEFVPSWYYEGLAKEREQAYQEAYDEGGLRAGFIPQMRWRLGQFNTAAIQKARQYGGLTVEKVSSLYNDIMADLYKLSDATRAKVNKFVTLVKNPRPTIASLKELARTELELISAYVNDINLSKYVPSMPSLPSWQTSEPSTISSEIE